MTVRVLFFSLLRDVTGREEMELEVAEGATLGEAFAQLMTAYPGLREWESKILFAVDREYAGREVVLSDGQEVAVMPPVQGG